MRHHASNQRRAVCLILGPPFHSSHSSWTSCLTTPQLPNQYYKDTEIPPPAYQPVCPPLPFCSILSIMSQSFSLLSSQQDAPPSGNLQQGSARLLKGPDESATTAQWRQRCRREKEGVRERERGMRQIVWTCGQAASAIPEGPTLVCWCR